MLIDRSHLSWALFSGISLIVGTVSYVSYAWNDPAGPSGGSAMGLLFGILGTLMMLFAGLLAARKPLRIRRIGSAQFWLKGHLWLGTLCIPFLLFHSGFGWGGLLEQLMWNALAVVAVSGFFGLAVHQFLPRMLWNRTPLETFESQTPYQCDRMTLISDLRITALCETPLVVPPGHLQEHYAKLISDFYSIVNGPGARGELNARKLLLLQQVSPQEVRDFCWAMAKYAKSEAKAIRFEGDFPELLEQTYVGLKASTVTSSLQSPQKTDPQAAEPDERQTDPAAELKMPVMSGVARAISKSESASKHNDTTPRQLAEPRTPSPPVDTGVPAALNPQANVVPAAIPGLSPMEMMRKKMAEKAKAAEPATAVQNTDIKVETPAKKSPLDMLKKNNPDANSAAPSPAKSLTPTPATVKPVPAQSAPAKGPAAQDKPVQPTALEKQLLRDVYLDHVRPFLSENRTRRSVRLSPLASAVEARRLFYEKESMLPATLHPILNELSEYCEIRRQIELQRKILRWMHWWLMIHVPAAAVLVIFLVAHIVMALRVIPFAG